MVHCVIEKTWFLLPDVVEETHGDDADRFIWEEEERQAFFEEQEVWE